MSLSKLQRTCFVDLSSPSIRTSNVTCFYDNPDNPDNIGYWRCGDCYTRFQANMTQKQMAEHLKSHPKKWQEIHGKDSEFYGQAAQLSWTNYG